MKTLITNIKRQTHETEQYPKETLSMKTILSKISTHKSTKKIKIARYWHRNRHTYVSMKQKIRNSPNTHVSDKSDVSKRK